MRVPLLVSSAYSLGFGAVLPAALARRARELGYGALALSDRNGVYGLPAFVEAAEAEGRRPIMGTELSWPGGRALLLAKDREGFARISRLLTARAEGRLDARRELADDTRGLVAATDDEALLSLAAGGLADRCASGGASVGALGGAAAGSESASGGASGGRLHALLSPCNRPRWRALLRTGARPLATGEVRFLEAGDRELQRLLLAIAGGKTVAEVGEAELSDPGALLLSPAAFEAAYAEVPEALAANEEAVESLGLSSLFGGWIFPRRQGCALADGAGAVERGGGGAGRGSGRAGGGADDSSDAGGGAGRGASEAGASGGAPEECGGAAALLRRLVLEGAERRYGKAGPEVLARIDYELGIIEEKGFSDYFLVVRDIAGRASRTCGRGSAAASVVSYALGITDVDPIRHGLYFERFLNPGRLDPPDIDVDFAWDERDALLAEVLADFGEDRAARVANHVRFKERSALREAARAYGMPEGEISGFERRAAADGEAAALEGACDDWRAIARLAPRLVGLPRHLGVHSGGLVVAPGPLSAIVPLERTGSGTRVTAWDKEGVEAAGLVKIDLLGNRSLAVVRDALANLAENGEGIDEDAWKPLEDEATIEMLGRGDTMGVFYVESPAMRLLQKKTGRGDFEHLVIHSSMIRPAANRYIDEYIDRLGGKPYAPIHPLLDGVLAETFGIMCYQEDVCKAAIALAGFGAAEADGMRKVLSKKDAKERLASFRARFEAGARERGVDEGTVAEVWAMIESFSGYSFVKAHSASYAMLSFKSAFLRRHHPAEFMAAVISNRGGYYSTLAYASEARRMGLGLLGPDANESGLRCRGRGSGLRFGLGMVAGLGQAAASRLVEERKARGPYRSVEDLARRARPDRSDAEALAGSGALDSLSPGLSRADKLMRLLSAAATREEGEGPGLFPDEGPALPRRASKETERRRLEAEMRYLGTTLAVHPLALWPEALSRRRSLAKDLSSLVGRRIELVGWPIAGKTVLAAGEEPMEFVSFEDETALYETVLFPEAYRGYRRLLLEERPLMVRGKVEEDRGGITLAVSSLERIG
ncbi:MAG TPA: DNA polymerase III subunit alpha [Spirochaetales bacterium]|nr:DNA polymerase III subunit alpha [Spirochaetales bacterium]